MAKEYLKIEKSKLAVFGSAFNPPHWGHFQIIQKAIKLFGFKKIILMPAGKPALKDKDLASIKDRLIMTKLFAKLDKRFIISNIEIKKAKKGKKSYTLTTIKELKKQYPKDEIYWLIGEDSLKEIISGKWHGGLKVLDEANFIVFSRPGYHFKLSPEIAKKIKKITLKIAISSTEIRNKIRQGKNVEKLLPKNILDYIQKKQLYR